MSVKHLVSVLLVIVMTVSVVMPAISASEKGVDLSAIVVEDRTAEIAVHTSTNSIDLGSLVNDDVSVTATNVGTSIARISFGVMDEGDSSLISDGLSINGNDWRDYSVDLYSAMSRILTVSLTLPSSAEEEDLDGNIVLWAEAVPPSAEKTWSLFHGDQQLTGYYDGDAPDTNEILWISEDIGCVPSSSVTIGEGKVFVYCFDLGTVSGKKQGYIAALDLETGELLWKEKTLLTNKWGSWATPAYHDGLVFTSGDVARYASNGTPAWPEGRCLVDATNGGPLIADGKVYIGNWDGSTYFAYDEKTGEQLWIYSVTGYAQGTPSYRDGKLYVTSWQDKNEDGAGYLYCLHAEKQPNNNQLIWQANSGDSGQNFCGSASLAYGYVYVTSYNFYGYGKLYCYSESDGTLIWSQTIQRTDSTPAIYDGKLYVSTGCYGYSDRQIFCIDAYTGDVIWSTDTSLQIGGWTNSPAIADGKVFVGVEGTGPNGDGEMVFGYVQIVALDLETGDIVWASEDPCGSSVAIHNGVAFSTGTDGKVYAYGSASA